MLLKAYNRETNGLRSVANLSGGSALLFGIADPETIIALGGSGMKKILSVILSVCLLFGSTVVVFADEAQKSGEGIEKDITILFTSDVHCGVDQNFGYAGLCEVIKHVEKSGDHVILVDDGDSIQGEPMGTVSKGEANIELMNEVGYDVAIPGNHEFDYGMENFLKLTEKADFPYISCNFNKEGELVFDPYVIKEFDDIKVAFVGVTTPETLTTSTPKYFQDENGEYIYGFFQDETGEGVYNAVQKAVDDARAEGADYVILMGHLGNQAECEPWTYYNVIENTTGIDAMLDGHSHDSDQVTVKNKDGVDVPRSACGTKLNGIGYCRISEKDGSITTGLYTYNNTVSAPALLNIENEISKEVDEANEKLNETFKKVIGKTQTDLTIFDPEAKDAQGNPIRIVRRAETNLGDLCADAYRSLLDTDVAIVNGGGIRVSIPAGDITVGDILKVLPFNNSVSAVEASGQQILDALEWGARAVPEEVGGFLQVSGLTYEINTDVESSCVQDDNGLFVKVDGDYRVQNVMVGDEPLDLNKKYSLAAISYILRDNGDGYTMFDDAKTLVEGSKLDNQALLEYIQDALGGAAGEKYADPYGDGRIVAVEGAAAEKGAKYSASDAGAVSADDASKASDADAAEEKTETVEDKAADESKASETEDLNADMPAGDNSFESWVNWLIEMLNSLGAAR